MKNPWFALLLFANGLILGIILGKMTPANVAQPNPVHFQQNRYQLRPEKDGMMSFFDQATGRQISFLQHEGLWFVMTYDPENGSVMYERTELIEDPYFLKAAEKLKNDLPDRLGRELKLDRLIE